MKETHDVKHKIELWYFIPEDRLYERYVHIFHTRVDSNCTIAVLIDHEINWDKWKFIGYL